MNEKDYNEIITIINELHDEFNDEEIRLRNSQNSKKVACDDLKSQILNYKKNDDIDYRVFSPRNNVSVNAEKISNLESERDRLEKDIDDITGQLRYYGGKADRLKKVLDILHKDKVSSIVSSEEENTINSDAIIIEKVERVKKDNSEQLVVREKSIISQNSVSNDNGISADSISKIIHKAEFSEKIMSNDLIRARIELKEVISELRNLVDVSRETF